MFNLSKFACIVFGAAILLTGCKGKDGDPGPTGAAGQGLTGSIAGFVSPTDENGGLLAKNGVIVSIDGANPAISATTNADGKYEFTNVRAGTYNLTYTRTGLATFHRYGLGHIGGDQPTYLGTLSMSQVSSMTVPSFTATSNPSSASVSLSLNVASPTPTSTFRYALFASASPTVNPATATLLFTSTGTGTTTSTFYSFSTIVSRASLNNAGFATGTTVYLAAFGSTAVLAGYSDPATGRVTYPALNPTGSSVAAVVVP
jgi:Carboxypeptidase regulatory-like domain